MTTTIVLLPGLNGTKGLFQPFIESMPDRFNVLPISYPTHTAMSYKQLSAFVINQLNSIVGNYILLGESFSGPLSLFVAEKKPKGLIGVILVATFVTAPVPKIARFLPWHLGFNLTKSLYALRLFFSKDTNASFIKAISYEIQQVSPAILADRIQQIFSVDAMFSLESCSVPVIYFQGINDFIVGKHNLRKVQLHAPNVKAVQFNTQHFLLQSAPEQAWDAISKFASDCS